MWQSDSSHKRSGARSYGQRRGTAPAEEEQPHLPPPLIQADPTDSGTILGTDELHCSSVLCRLNRTDGPARQRGPDEGAAFRTEEWEPRCGRDAFQGPRPGKDHAMTTL